MTDDGGAGAAADPGGSGADGATDAAGGRDDRPWGWLGEHAELRRRLVHVSGAAVPLSYLLGLVAWPVVVWFTVLATLVAVALEALRLSGRVDWRIYDELTREYEADNPAGYALYMLGIATVALALGPSASPAPGAPLAVAAMLMLAVGDPISGVLGSTGAEGVKDAYVLVVMFVVCLLLALATGLPVAVAVAGAVLATVADGVKPVVAGFVVDDNLTIPVGAGAAMWVVATLA